MPYRFQTILGKTEYVMLLLLSNDTRLKENGFFFL